MIKTAIVTGSRAEWGLLKPLVEAMIGDKDFFVMLIITGSHLSPEFGLTRQHILAEQKNIVENLVKNLDRLTHIEMLLSSVTSVGICKSISLGLSSFAEVFNRWRPDLLILLGDRYEILAAALAAYTMNIPIAHIHGGETTKGSLDNAYRHSITHMSQLHFTAHEQYRQKVIQLGNDPGIVFDVGCLGLQDLPEPIFPKDEKQIVLLFHPATRDAEASKRTFDHLTNVLLYEPFKRIYAIGSNADCGGMYINQSLKQMARANQNVIYLPSVRRSEFLELLNESIAIVGNSSCGIYEAPALGTATINVGNRQSGRLRASSVIDCNVTPQGIEAALDVLYSEEFRESLKDIQMPYRGGGVTGHIIKVIKYFLNKKGKG